MPFQIWHFVCGELNPSHIFQNKISSQELLDICNFVNEIKKKNQF